jgi:hypothetical protein
MYRSQPRVVVVPNDGRSGLPLDLLTFFWIGLISGFGLAFALVGLAALMFH